MTTTEQQREYERITNMQFSCTQSVIQEWIASYLELDVDEVFPDYTVESDVIGVKIGNTQYNGYVVTLPYDMESQVDMKFMKENENISKTCSLLYDAVYIVFSSVLHTIQDKYKPRVLSLRPSFNENNLNFNLVYINIKAETAKQILEQRINIAKYLEKCEKEHVLIEDSQMEIINKKIEEFNKILLNISEDDMKNEEIKCMLENEKLKQFDRLFICIDETTSDVLNADDPSFLLSRLPEFGLKFQDPDEPTLIDIIKNNGKI